MKLYHGTSARYLDKILKQGLKPRGKRKGNWEHTVLSNPSAVYMTVAYSLHYAMSACKKGDDCLILEIDSTKLNPFLFTPDEDFLEQATREHPDFKTMRAAISEDTRMKVMTEYFRGRLMDFGDNWELSIKHLGNCCYFGNVPLSAITRYAIIKRNDPVIFASDPTITLLNYRIMEGYYRSLSAMVFGDLPTIAEDDFNFDRLPPKELFNKIQVTTL